MGLTNTPAARRTRFAANPRGLSLTLRVGQNRKETLTKCPGGQDHENNGLANPLVPAAHVENLYPA
jgi:hypothetical protein